VPDVAFSRGKVISVAELLLTAKTYRKDRIKEYDAFAAIR